MTLESVKRNYKKFGRGNYTTTIRHVIEKLSTDIIVNSPKLHFSFIFHEVFDLYRSLFSLYIESELLISAYFGRRFFCRFFHIGIAGTCNFEVLFSRGGFKTNFKAIITNCRGIKYKLKCRGDISWFDKEQYFLTPPCSTL